MYLALARHPGIFVPQLKEPHFFARDLDSGSYLDSLYFVRSAQEYLALFEDARPDQLTGEGSTTYLFSKVAAKDIAAVRPDARILMMLRDPVEMIHSFHERRVYSGSEDLVRFEDALAAEEARRSGWGIPPNARNIPALQYRELGRYAEQVERFLRHFPRHQIHVIEFREFAMEPAAAHAGTLAFLGLPPHEQPSVERENVAPSVRSVRLHRLVHSRRAVRLARAALPVGARSRIREAAERLTTVETAREPLDAALRTHLRDDFRADVRRLGELLGRDFESLWS
jgi:hypothetical protein